MIEFLKEFFHHLMFIGLCLFFMNILQKLFLIILKKTVQAHMFYFDKKTEIKSNKCAINIENIRNISGELLPSHLRSAKFDWVDIKKDYFCIRIYNDELPKNEQASSSIMLYLSPEEVPTLFAFKLISIILMYRWLPITFKSGSINLKLSKKMLRLIEIKLGKIRTHNFNSEKLR